MKLNSLQDLSYTGKIQTPKLFNVETVVLYDYTKLSSKQTELYERLLYGLKYYSKIELVQMHASKKTRIEKAHERCQMVLNLWKQELIIDWSNKLLKALLPNSTLTQFLLAESKPNYNVHNTMSFKELGLSRRMVISKLLEERLLPSNFATL